MALFYASFKLPFHTQQILLVATLTLAAKIKIEINSITLRFTLGTGGVLINEHDYYHAFHVLIALWNA